jgi:flotillin
METLVLGGLLLLTLGLGAGFLLVSLLYRRVVETNEVHIVQSSKATKSYGKDTSNGNSYYEWPSWIPGLGITKIVLPVSVFDLDLVGYEAYDKGRLPFMVDVKAFFRITDSNMAAQRVASFEELQSQLKAIVQGAVRTILASNEIEEIMQGRSTFGEQFTKEVNGQLKEWGVETVKNIELMDIRDGKDAQVIRNIMEKKKSLIEMQSRTEVANNKRAAEIAEVEAFREVQLQKQAAEQSIGLRTVENKRQVELANQEMAQAVKQQETLTKEKEMEVLRVQHVKTADINKQVQLVKASQDKETAEIAKQMEVIKANQIKETSIIVAEGKLEAEKRAAQGLEAQGNAKAAAEKALQLAPVEAQIVLAKEIGSNESYQKYLITIEQIKATQAVGTQQAKALENAEVKIISNTGNATQGLNSVGELFSSGGGVKLGSMLEGLANTDVGSALLAKFGVSDTASSSSSSTTTNGSGKAPLMNGKH